MPSLVFDYSTFLEDMREHAFGTAGFGGVHRGSWVNKEPEDPVRFFTVSDYCPFCNNALEQAFDRNEEGAVNSRTRYKARDLVLACRFCGWWKWTQDLDQHYTNDFDETHDTYRSRHRYAIVKSFPVDDKSLPIDLLAKELKKNKALLYEIHPSKLETLAQRVFEEHYHCEVRHVGKSHDGGIDLIIVNSDEPILVQVKRRSNPGHVEGVQVVRDLIGAMFIEDAVSGIVLSTAGHFSRIAHATVNTLLSNRKLRQFQLIDYASFCDMVEVLKNDEQPVWEKLIETEIAERPRSIRPPV